MDTLERYRCSMAEDKVAVVVSRGYDGKFVAEFIGGNLDGFTCDHADPDELQEAAMSYAQMAARMERGC